MTPSDAQWLDGLIRGAAAPDEAATIEAYDAALPELRAAMWRSPALLAVIRSFGASPADLVSIDALSALPVTDRQLLARDLAKLVAVPIDDPRLDGLTIAWSTGTSGAPVRVTRCARDRAWPAVVARFAAQTRGIALPDRPSVALWCVLPDRREYVGEDENGRYARIAADGPSAVERLIAADVDVLSTDPAGLQRLVELGASIRPRIAVSSAQHLAPGLRAAASSVLACPVIDVYSLAESGPIAVACPDDDDAWHVLAPYVAAESVDGELVVTRLRDSAFPLVRYATGDRGTVAWERCVCGCSGPVIRGLSGRSPAWFAGPEGRRFDAWALSTVFRWRRVDAFRVTQVAIHEFDVAIDGADLDVGPSLVEALGRMGIVGARVRVDRVATGALAGPKPTPFASRLITAGAAPW